MDVSFEPGTVAAVDVSFGEVIGASVAGGNGMRVRVPTGLGTGLETSDGRVAAVSLGEGVTRVGRAPPQPTHTASMSNTAPTTVSLTLARPP